MSMVRNSNRKRRSAMIEMWWDPVLFEQELNRLDKITEKDFYGSVIKNFSTSNDSNAKNDDDIAL